MVDPDDVLVSVSLLTSTFAPVLDTGSWGAQAGDLEWNCRRTLDHVAGALLSYSTHLALRAPGRLTYPRTSYADSDAGELVAMVDAFAHVLAEVVRAAPDGVRGFHPLGVADPSGFAGMGCDEILVHGFDIAQGLGIEIDPPRDLCARVLGRLFPWADVPGDAWSGLLWANGRVALADRDRIAPDWAALPAPLSEWDGTVNKKPS